MKTEEYDLVVIGAGSGGYAAARCARDLGARVAVVDRGPLGGLCILRGCMPSKALIASSDALADARHAGELGIRIGGSIEVDMPFIAERKRDLVKEFADYRIEGIEAFDLYRGDARFIARDTVVVGDVQLSATSFVIATGSIIAHPSIEGLNEVGALDSDTVLELESIPGSVAVLGTGYIGCELGQFLARAGAKTTMIGRSPRVLAAQDDDIGDTLTESLRNEGIEIVTNASIVRVAREGEKKAVYFRRDGSEFRIEADELFNALGRVADTADLDLDVAGVTLGRDGAIAIDDTMRTSNPNIFAVGDVTGEYMLVHVAIYQGEIAAENAVNGGRKVADYRVVPAHTVFSEPQVAVVGKSEKALQREGRTYVSGRYDFAEHGKAMCLNKTDGFVKMLADTDTGEILGASVIGAQGSELIHEVIVAMHYRSTVQDFMRIPHLHPTLSEIWTYPAEECCEKLGKRTAPDQMLETATVIATPGRS